MATRSSLYNEERNLLRIKERERRNQEVHQEKGTFLENAPLFGEPYKTNKGDKLSSLIQSMLGNYEEVNELISSKTHQDLIGIRKVISPLPANGKSDRPHLTENTQPSFHNNSRLPPTASPPSTCPGLLQKHQSFSEDASCQLSVSYSSSHSQHLSTDCSNSMYRSQQLRNDKWLKQEEYTLPSVPLPDLSPPAEPLSPLHSSEPSDSEPHNKDTNSPLYIPNSGPSKAKKSDAPIVSVISETSQLPLQTFPPSLPTKTNPVMQQKPTAYVRPMDGQDQAPSDSPVLKPSPDEYHEQPYGNTSDLKTNIKAKLSKLKIPSQPVETLSNEVQCVEEILREMTHSWPAPLTAIHTPSTVEPSKFHFVAKDSQQIHSVFLGQKNCELPSKVTSPDSQQRGAHALQRSSLVSTLSGTVTSESSSESDSTSGSESESESSSSGSEEPACTQVSIASEVDTPTVNKWQLDNWIVKSGQQSSLQEGQCDSNQRGKDSFKEQKRPKPEEQLKSNGSCKTNTENADKDATDTLKKKTQVMGCLMTCPSNKQSSSQRQNGGEKQLCQHDPVPPPEASKKNLSEGCERPPTKGNSNSHVEKPKVKTKPHQENRSSKSSSVKMHKHISSEKKKHIYPKPTINKVIESVCEGKKRADHGVPTHCDSPSRFVSRTSASKAVQSENNLGDDPHSLTSLIVKIDLSLLSRIPQIKEKEKIQTKAAVVLSASSGKAHDADKKTVKLSVKSHKKRQGEENKECIEKKKPKLEKQVKQKSVKDSTKIKLSKSSKEKEKNVVQLETPPSSQEPVKEGEHKSHNAESNKVSLVSESSKVMNIHSSSKRKRTQEKGVEDVKNVKKPSKSGTNACLSDPSSDRKLKPSKPLLNFDERKYSVEHHMKEAKKLKHKADAISDKVEKAFNYLDAALSFIESGIAMESDPKTPKSAYTMFSETVDLIKFIVKLKHFLDSSAQATEKAFAVLCLRCQALLLMAMFRYKKDDALKYSRTLNEHFKNSTRSAQTPSPCIARSTGTPSPMSPMPSPASQGILSVGSLLSSTSTTVSVPHPIPQMASSYINITSLFLTAHDLWEQADAIAQKNNELVAELDLAVGPLTLTTSMSTLVRYTRQGLYWLKLETKKSALKETTP
ncbi:AF4/FMR2 family member 1-like isoform X1 [Polypterus senegalus]|uniref:AF4/FMR2 family member 1-like isoform X1 n=1 Tax=Polypterus senegalus TaxID=55291 RepID=UPI0019664BBB|nr:AF4/FMR2 family member 1-like isoform X1 [Polypterus senegalus]